MSIRVGWKFDCDNCPFTAECERKGTTNKSCEVIDYHNTYVTIKPPEGNTLVFVVQHGVNEDIIPTEKEAASKSLLEKARDKTLKED